MLREFAEIGPPAGYDCQWLDAEATLSRSDAVRHENLQGALWSGTEMTVDPREVAAKFKAYLSEIGVECRYGSTVKRIELPLVETSTERWEVDTAIVCGATISKHSIPKFSAASGLTRCKLQMMRTSLQPNDWRLGPALAAGLTLRFYKAFAICSTLQMLKARIAAEKPEYEQWAIHVLASQTSDGAITLGDSHEYGLDVNIFDRTSIDDLILREARTFLKLPCWHIAERWHGIYALHPKLPFFEAEPAPGVRIVTAPGGSGMTLSFALAEQTVRSLA